MIVDVEEMGEAGGDGGSLADGGKVKKSKGGHRETSRRKSMFDQEDPHKISAGRLKVLTLIQHPRFEKVVLTLIFLSSVLLIVDSPLLDPDAPGTVSLAVTDFLFCLAFTAEAALKIYALGCAYLRSGWNQLDFFIVSTGLFTLMLAPPQWMTGTDAGNGGGMSSIRALRTLRALRPLRAVSRNPGLKLVVAAVMDSLLSVGQLVLIFGLVCLIFAIICVSYFKGALGECHPHEQLMDLLARAKPTYFGDGGADGSYWGNLAAYSPPYAGIADDTNRTLAADGWWDEQIEKKGKDFASESWGVTKALDDFYVRSATFPHTPLDLLQYPVSYAELNREQRSWGADYRGYAWTWKEVNGTNTTVLASYDGDGYTPSDMSSLAVCEWLGGDWGPTIDQRFDNVPQAMLTLYEMTTTEGWTGVMYAMVDQNGIDMQPIRDLHPWWALMPAGFVLVGAFFMLNLFVAVVIDAFNKSNATHEDGTSDLLTPEQQEWVKLQSMMLKVKPNDKNTKPWVFVCYPCWYAVVPEENAAKMEVFVMSLIVINTGFMAANHMGIDRGFEVVLEQANVFFCVIFGFEMVMKLSALGWCRYMRDPWNRFDAFITTSALIAVVVQASSDGIGDDEGYNTYIPTSFTQSGQTSGTANRFDGYLDDDGNSGSGASAGSGFGALIPILRCLRVGRIFRLVGQARNLRALFNALLLTWPSMINICSLITLVYLVFAAIGVQLFAKVQLTDDGELNLHANFQRFDTAMLVLIRCSTGEAWNSIMHELALDRDDCEENPSYQIDGIQRGCGTALAFPYFITFVLLVNIVFLNLFIAPLTACLETSSTTETGNLIECDDGAGNVAGLTEPEYKILCEEWSLLDRQLLWMIREGDLSLLIHRMPHPLGVSKETETERAKRHADRMEDKKNAQMARLSITDGRGRAASEISEDGGSEEKRRGTRTSLRKSLVAMTRRERKGSKSKANKEEAKVEKSGAGGEGEAELSGEQKAPWKAKMEAKQAAKEAKEAKETAKEAAKEAKAKAAQV
jgi:hypothetical protein